ncbi:hypothetical protein ABB37_04704 [Leptomonas pyrrhocoris]|uniref:Sec16 Sec23-binding domain-containing protein n=1 Tax=Leptomonas pyrrhocoris TaxID=157538 RepID=A0A0M9G1W6_LEPPY|nr:hypothetical protein ABB37_04704 [Leptomonas pyrrhocoris]KPA80486.1 hypothetical protein ABB37_04704 [Leptomonas pyrrhocoris]|eukprot:XP_015658925.1 hypothetical protein ABB37_04704 [Leptomonas pyrrhocoris]
MNKTPTTTTAPAAPGYSSIPTANGSRPPSRHSGTRPVAPATSAATIAAGSRRALSSTVVPSPNTAAASLHRDIPSFLQPSGSAGGLLLSRRGGAAAATAGTGAHGTSTSSRGRELLEAALKSRGSRGSQLRSSDAVQPATPAERSLTSLHSKEKMERDSADGAPALEMRKPAAPVTDGVASAASQEGVRKEDGVFSGHRRTSTGDYSIASRSYRAADASGCTSPVLCVPALQPGQPPAHDGPTNHKDGHTFSSSARAERTSNELIAGEVDASTNEVCDIAHSHTPRSGAMEPLPTPTEETSQRNTSASPGLLPQSATLLPQPAEEEEREKDDGKQATTSAAARGCNPFLDSGADEADAVFGLDAPLVDASPLPEQPPPLTLTGDAARTQPFNPFADAPRTGGGRAEVPLAPPPLPKPQLSQQHPRQQTSQRGPPTSVAAPPLQPPPLPPLPPPRLATPNGAASLYPNNDYKTPRGGAAGGSVPQAQQQQPSTGLPLPSTSFGSAVRGSYAASPYVREGEGARAVYEDSPLPLRPPSFNSMPQLEGEEAQAQAHEQEQEQEQEQVVPSLEGKDDDLGGHLLQQEQQQQPVNYEGDGGSNSVEHPFEWDTTEPGMGNAAANADVDDGSYLSSSEEQSARARRLTQLPSDTIAQVTLAAHHDPHPHAASPSFPENRAAAAAAVLTELSAVEQTYPQAEAPPPPPPPLLPHSVPADHNRGAPNPFASRRPDSSVGRVDDARLQHQGLLPSRVQVAQQLAPGDAAAAMTREHPQNSPNGEGEAPARHQCEGLSQISAAFLDTHFDSGNNTAQAYLRSASPPAPPPPLQPQQPPGSSSPHDVKEHDDYSHASFASASNPFLDTNEEALPPPGNQTAAATAATTTSKLHVKPVLKPPNALNISLNSLTPQQMSPNVFSASLEPLGGNANPPPGQPISNPSSVNGGPPLSLNEDDLNAAVNSNNAIPTNGVSVGAASQTPSGLALVNPFSKAARNSAGTAVADVGSTAGQSPATSLTSSFAGRRKSRRLSAPSFAIFVGGAATGVPDTEVRRGVSCIAACFNHPRTPSPPGNVGVHGNGATAGRTCSPPAQASPGSGAVSHASSFRTPPANASNRPSGAATATPRSAGATNERSSSNNGGRNTLSSGSGIYLSFCSMTEALTAKGSVIDRKGIRGTESGRRYLRVLRDAVLPCALAANEWAANGPRWCDMEAAMQSLENCVSSPLASVLTIILKDAMKEETQEGFVWKDNGGRRLGELLLVSAQAEARKHAITASDGRGNAALASALNASPLNSSIAGGGSSVVMDAKEKSAALLKVEDLLCTGQRVEAVGVALEARLYVHALLISMMCPTKDEYLRTVQAVTQKELLSYSPLAQAYSMFNELPLPPLLPPSLPQASAKHEEEDGAAGQDARRTRELLLRDQAILNGTWRRQAAMLVANFTRHSGEGLLRLAGNLHQLHLVVEAHTCLLLLHLTPLGMAGPVRAGAPPLPPVSTMSAEEIEDVLPRPDQRQVMDEIRRRIGVVGGWYHPTQGCRASFLTPVTTLLTQLLQLAREQLNARAPPLEVPGLAGPPVPFHGLPGCPPRTDVGYRMMQVLWLREVGLVRESKQALAALRQRMPTPAAFSLCAPPRTLNELVYLFGGLPPPPPPESFGAESPTLPRDVSTPGSTSGSRHPFSNTASIALETHSAEERRLDSGEFVGRGGRDGSGQIPSSPDDRQADQQLLPQPPQQQQQGKPPAVTGLTPTQRATALQPPTRPQQQPPPPPPSNTRSPPAPPPPQTAAARPEERTDGNRNKPAAKPAAKPASRRSRSMDALRNFFFRRGKSEAEGGEKTEEAKPMHLDTEKAPAFDPVTGRWMFPETDEEKKLRELTKQGPPKMAPKAAAAAEPAGVAGGGPLAPRARSPPGLPPSSAPAAAGGGGATRPAPTHGAPAPKFAPGRGAPPPMMAGRGGVRRPGGRQQYVDAFNNAN